LIKSVNEALGARDTAYAKELAHQRELDDLCKAFAAVAAPFYKWMDTTKESVSSSTKDVEPQLEALVKLSSSMAQDSKVEACRTAAAAMEAKNIVYNPHTTLTQTDIDAAWSQYEVFLSKKKVMLEEAVSHKKMRGISQEDWDEINKNFAAFDKDKSGQIDKKELKACLYSLGEEKTKAEIEAYVKKYGDGTKVPKNGFTELMLTIVGVTDTIDTTLASFALLNQQVVGAQLPDPYPGVSKVKLAIVMDDHDLAYIDKNAPKKGDGYDYKKFTDDMFSR
jgi:hypothetical protein